MTKTLILIRHGHRDTTRRELDNGLDDKGKDQAKNLRRFFTARFSKADLKGGLWLVSSPKLRCIETLQPIAKAVEQQINIHPALDEQTGNESFAALKGRVTSFLEEWQKAQISLTVLSSHGDWLPIAIEMLVGVSSLEPKKGSWFEVESGGEPGACSLRWYLPSFKHLYL